MNCLQGKVKGVISTDWGGNLHWDGHQYGDALKQMSRAKFNSLAHLFKDISPLANMSPEEAFAEGYVIAIFDPYDLNGQVLLRSVSRLSLQGAHADPDPGAPDPEEEEAVKVEHN